MLVSVRIRRCGGNNNFSSKVCFFSLSGQYKSSLIYKCGTEQSLIPGSYIKNLGTVACTCNINTELAEMGGSLGVVGR